MRIMTTNIWGDYFGNPTNVREDGIFNVYEVYKPDVIGLQEVTNGWYESHLFERLSKEYFLVGTELTDNVNYVPMAVKKEYEILAKGYERLKDTPDESKAITWAVIKHKETGMVAGVVNTHFWWKYGEEKYDLWRCENAEQLSALMKYINERFSCPVFSFGDMNGGRENRIFTDVYDKKDIIPLFDLASDRDDICSLHGDPVADKKGLYHGKTTDKDQTSSLDHILSLGKVGFKVLQYRVVTDSFALDATDHSPVFADVKFTNEV